MKRKYKFSKNDLIIIQRFVNNINEDIEIKKSNRWEVDQDELIIYLGTKEPNKQSDYFYEWFAQQDFFTPIDITIVSLLHEIGHIMKGYSAETLEERERLNNIYNFLYTQNIINVKQLNFAYFEIPEELQATQWAVNYYLENKQECEELAEMLGLYDLD
jgi:HD superfamily phosphohydrolase